MRQMLKKLRFSYKARPKDLQDDVVFEDIIDKGDVLVWMSKKAKVLDRGHHSFSMQFMHCFKSVPSLLII